MRLTLACLLLLLSTSAAAQTAPCSGDFGAFVAELQAEAIATGRDPATAQAFFSGVRPSSPSRAA